VHLWDPVQTNKYKINIKLKEDAIGKWFVRAKKQII